MRKFLTTMFAASALALPAMATLPADPTGRDQSRPGTRDDDDRPSRAERGAARDDNRAGERAERQRPERPSVDRAGPPQRQRDRPANEVGRPRPAPRADDERAPPRRDDRVMSPERIERIRDRPSPDRTPTDPVTAPRDRDGRPGGIFIDRDGRPDGSFGNTVGRQQPQHRDWNRGWRDDRRYDWRNWRERNRSTFRLGFYHDPYGYQYRRWMIGWSMRPYYYRSSYWIADPWRYRLPEVYGPYRWVRYYNDAVLVNSWTGEVVDVIYGFFW